MSTLSQVEFDLWRRGNCKQAFNDIIAFAELGKGKTCLNRPGTGQATSPLLETGCDYTGIELGKHLCVRAGKVFGLSKLPNVERGLLHIRFPK